MVDATANFLMLIVTRSASANAVLTILFKLMLMKVPKNIPNDNANSNAKTQLNAITDETINASTYFSANANKVAFRDRLYLASLFTFLFIQIQHIIITHHAWKYESDTC